MNYVVGSFEHGLIYWMGYKQDVLSERNFNNIISTPLHSLMIDKTRQFKPG